MNDLIDSTSTEDRRAIVLWWAQRGMCPDCGGILCHAEGIATCLRCGWTTNLRTITATFAGSLKSDDDRQNSGGRL